MRNSKFNYYSAFILFQLLGFSVNAQSTDQLIKGVSNDWVLLGALMGTFLTLLLIFIVLVIAAYSVFYAYAPKATKPATIEEKTPFWQWFWIKLNAAVPKSKEKDIMMDHAYDGIKELDNDLPPWWKYGFYLSIVSAVVYLYVYHAGPHTHTVSVREYIAEQKQAEIDRAAYLTRMENQIDETNVELLSDQPELEVGKGIYLQNCKVCHGGAGEGGVGPNLTDPYWLHGGSVKDIFSTVKYGVQEKGMISWEKKLTPKQIQQVASFIVSLENSNPPNAKEPQGKPYERTATTAKEAPKDISMR